MNRFFTMIMSFGITALVVLVLHESFMDKFESTEPIVFMEVLAVVAIILGLSLGHIVETVRIVFGDSEERLSVSFLDILKILLTVAASGAMYLGLLKYFKVLPHTNP